METFFDKYKTIFQASTWVLLMVIYPAIVWFVGVDYKFISFEKKADEFYSILTEKEKKLTTLENRMTVLENRISDKLEAIHKDLGEVKGELKRLR